MKFVKAVLALTCLLVLTGSALAEPEVEIPEHEFNFGRTLQRMKITHTFWIKSVGEDTLRITKVEPGCSCNEVPLTDSVIAPGDSVPLKVIFSTGSYRSNTLKKPHIYTNAGDEPTYMKIHADIYSNPEKMSPLVLRPPAVELSVYSYKDMHQRATFHIVNKADRDFNLTLVDASDKPVTVELPGKVKAGETVTGVVNVREEFLNTDFLGSFTFEIDDDLRSRYTVPFRRFLPPVDPDSVETEADESR